MTSSTRSGLAALRFSRISTWRPRAIGAVGGFEEAMSVASAGVLTRDAGRVGCIVLRAVCLFFLGAMLRLKGCHHKGITRGMLGKAANQTKIVERRPRSRRE